MTYIPYLIESIPTVTDPTNSFSDSVTLMLAELFFDKKNGNHEYADYSLVSGFIPNSDKYYLKIQSKGSLNLDEYKDKLTSLLNHLELKALYIVYETNALKVIFNKNTNNKKNYNYLKISNITHKILETIIIPEDIFTSMVSSFIGSLDYNLPVYSYFKSIFKENNIENSTNKKYILDKISATLVFVSLTK